MTTDPLADLLTRLRNASKARHEWTQVPASRLKKNILEVLKRHNRIKDFEEVNDANGKPTLRIALIEGRPLALRRISSPGQRIYKGAAELRPLLRGYGISILSTSQGVMTGDEAKAKGVGGELLCEMD